MLIVINFRLERRANGFILDIILITEIFLLFLVSEFFALSWS